MSLGFSSDIYGGSFIGFTCKNDNVSINKTPKKETTKQKIATLSMIVEFGGVANALISSDTLLLLFGLLLFVSLF